MKTQEDRMPAVTGGRYLAPDRRYRRGSSALLGLASGALLAGSGVVAAQVPVVEVESGATLVIEGGAYGIGCGVLDILGRVELQQGSLTAGNWLGQQGSSTLAGTSAINIGGDWTNLGAFAPGTSTVTLSGVCKGGEPVRLTGTTTFYDLILTEDAVIPPGERTQVLNRLDCNGNRLIPSNNLPSYIRLAPTAVVQRCQLDGVRILQDSLNPKPEPIPAAGPLGLLVLLITMAGLAARRLRTGPAPSTSRSRRPTSI